MVAMLPVGEQKGFNNRNVDDITILHEKHCRLTNPDYDINPCTHDDDGTVSYTQHMEQAGTKGIRETTLQIIKERR